MFQKNCCKYLSLVLAIFLFHACATPTKRFHGVTISPTVPGKADDLVHTKPIQTIGVARSGLYSGGFEFYFSDPEDRRNSGAVEGAGMGAQATIGLATATGGIGLVAAPVLVPFGMIVGSVGKTRPPISNEKEEQLRYIAENFLGYESTQEKLVRKVIQFGQEYGKTHMEAFDLACVPGHDCEEGFLKQVGFDTVLEIQVIRLGLAEVVGEAHSFQLAMDGWAKLISTSDQKVIRYRPFAVRSLPQGIRDYLDEKSRLLEKEYNLWLDILARNIVQAMVFRPDTVPVYDDTYCWVKPLEPEDKKQFSAKVTSNTPVFRWTPFSKNADRVISGLNVPVEIKDVTYDIRISRFEETAESRYKKSRVFYERSGLTEPEHIISEPLEKHESFRHFYTWNVRVYFLENGIPRRTEWSHRIYKPKNIPRGWRIITEKMEPVWPLEWDLTNHDRKTISQDVINRLHCLSHPTHWRWWSYKFKIEEEVPQN